MNTGTVLQRLLKQVWVRAAIFTVIAVVLALAAGAFGTLLPFPYALDIGQNSVGSILQIIASSMLAVTTFSLTAMVTAYSSATTIATPRATQLLVQDRTSQNVLSTFVGAFAFALVGIIALSTGFYGEQGRFILFLGTLVVIAMVVVTLLRWIAHLTTFGRMADVIDRVEAASSSTLRAYATAPALGARRWDGVDRVGEPVGAAEAGYVTHLDLAAIDRAAASVDGTVRVLAMPGAMVARGAPVALLQAQHPDAAGQAIAAAFTIRPHRDFDQDPRMGVIALAEIASRALSPATNDPGTAIEIIAALQRVFAQTLATRPDDEVRFGHVLVPPVSMGDLSVDAFRPIARDGASVVEVQIRLQKCLAALAAASSHPTVFRAAALDAQQRADAQLGEADRRALADEIDAVWAPVG